MIVLNQKWLLCYLYLRLSNLKPEVQELERGLVASLVMYPRYFGMNPRSKTSVTIINFSCKVIMFFFILDICLILTILTIEIMAFWLSWLLKLRPRNFRNLRKIELKWRFRAIWFYFAHFVMQQAPRPLLQRPRISLHFQLRRKLTRAALQLRLQQLRQVFKLMLIR